MDYQRICARFILLTALAGCGGGDDTPAVTFQGNCTHPAPSAEAQKTAGRQTDGSAILPGGRRISPLGMQVPVGGFPMAARVLPGGKHAIVTDGAYGTEYLSIVDLTTGAMTYREAFEGKKALFWGIVIRPSDGRIYVSGGSDDHIYVYDYNAATGMLTSPIAPPKLVGPDPGSNNLIAGLGLSNDGKTLYAVGQLSSSLIAIDADTLVEKGSWLLMAEHPMDLAIAPAASGRNEAYVTAWGGGQLMVIDLATAFGTSPVKARIDTGKSPGSLALVPPRGDRAVVAASDSDTLTLIDLPSRTVERTIMAGRAAAMPLGTAPSHVAITPDGLRVYVTDAGENAVDVLDGSTFARLGRFPTGWWPTGVAIGENGDLVVTNGKGLGAGPLPEDHGSDFVKGNVSIMKAPTDTELGALTQTALTNNTRPRDYAATPVCPAEKPMNVVPLHKGDATPIQHVFVIVKENKTYDADLGDLVGSNGDPSLVLFGEHYTPNLHALARAFSNLDNYYANSEASLQGHEWTTTATTTDFVEKTWLTTWGRYTQSISNFATPLVEPQQGFIWQQLERQHVPYYNMGEANGALIGQPPAGQDRYDLHYPGVFFDLTTKDATKAAYVKSLLDGDPTFPPLVYIGLPNDHTEGTSPGKQTPGSMVADNDEGAGIIVEALSKSKFWASSVVFVLEDDPQDGGDHVEGHRSIMVVAGPWVKRGYVSHIHYDIPAMWVTIERMLGLEPLSLYTEDAAPMYDIFTDKPDLTPYTHIARQVPEATNPATSPLSAMSARMDFSKPDNAPGLGRVLWRAMKGVEPPWYPKRPQLAADDDDDVRKAAVGAHAKAKQDRDDDDDVKPAKPVAGAKVDADRDDDDDEVGMPDGDGDDDDGPNPAAETFKDAPLPRYTGEQPAP